MNGRRAIKPHPVAFRADPHYLYGARRFKVEHVSSISLEHDSVRSRAAVVKVVQVEVDVVLAQGDPVPFCRHGDRHDRHGHRNGHHEGGDRCGVKVSHDFGCGGDAGAPVPDG